MEYVGKRDYALPLHRLVLVLVLFSVASGGCNPFTAYEGGYMEAAVIALSNSPREGPDRSGVQAGSGWVLKVYSYRNRPGWMSGVMKQGNLGLEFESRPPLNTAIDLATAPRQVSYEYGSEMVTYVSRRATGTLVLTALPEGTLVADVHAVLSAPIVGSGSRTVTCKVRLEKYERRVGQSADAGPDSQAAE